MFTGLVEHVGTVVQIRSTGKAKQLRIDLGPLAKDIEVGQSMAVDGVCQTARAVDGRQASFDVSPQTLSITTLGEFVASRRVNLERPITMQTRLGGHLVAGHVDGLASLERWTIQGQNRIGRFQADSELMNFMIEKGSVSLNGVSLTIAELAEGAFSVALIPETMERTNLGQLQPGQKVNIETDLIGKYVAKFVKGLPSGGLSMEMLRDNGFV